MPRVARFMGQGGDVVHGLPVSHEDALFIDERGTGGERAGAFVGALLVFDPTFLNHGA